MVIFDTNAILRYILQDKQEMANAVAEKLSSNRCIIPIEVIAEIVYVLNKVYKIERKIIAIQILKIIDIDEQTIINCDVVKVALNTFSETKLDFVDCLFVGYAKIMKYDVFTFDNKLQKQIDKVTKIK